MPANQHGTSEEISSSKLHWEISGSINPAAQGEKGDDPDDEPPEEDGGECESTQYNIEKTKVKVSAMVWRSRDVCNGTAAFSGDRVMGKGRVKDWYPRSSSLALYFIQLSVYWLPPSPLPGQFSCTVTFGKLGSSWNSSPPDSFLTLNKGK